MLSWPTWNELREQSTNEMSGNGHQLGQRESLKNPNDIRRDEVRGWIERVIVPALVDKFLKEIGPQRDELTDNASR